MRIRYVTTTFPVYSETFLQREALAMKGLGVDLRVLSMHRGEATFEGLRIDRFSKWRLLTLVWRLPFVLFVYWSAAKDIRRAMCSKPPFWLSFWENLLGLGAGIVEAERIRAEKPDLIHCVWSSGPAAFGWMVSRMTGIPFSCGAHAYDVFKYGGDWMLSEKLEAALLVHTSTRAAQLEIEKRIGGEKARMIRRGLNRLPVFREARDAIGTLRIVCVARLVEKKGFPYQFSIYRALKDRGIAFEAMILGDGPLRDWMEEELRRLELVDEVALLGRVSESEVMERLQWADALFHTGVVAKSGDRDGLPNVVPEAMASGVLVIGSPVSGVVEAVVDGETGFLADVDDIDLWVERCGEILGSKETRERLAANARAWVERSFVAETNTGALLSEMRRVLGK